MTAELFCTGKNQMIKEATKAKVHYDDNDDHDPNAHMMVTQLTSSKISQTRYGAPLSATNVLNDIESKTLTVNSSSTRFR